MKAIKHNISAKKISLIFIVRSSGGAIASITFELVKILHEHGENWSLVNRRAIKTRPLSLALFYFLNIYRSLCWCFGTHRDKRRLFNCFLMGYQVVAAIRCWQWRAKGDREKE